MSAPETAIALHPVSIDSGDPEDEQRVTFDSQDSLRRSGIMTAVVEQKPIVERVETNGVITYDERSTASLSARASGTVWKVAKHVGETVRRGDILVIIDAAEVGKCKAEFLSALVAVESKDEALKNLESVADGVVPQRQIRETRSGLREARIRLLNAKQTLINLGFSLKSEEFEKLGDPERARQIHFLGLPETLVQSLDQASITSNLLPVAATLDGIVLHQDVVTGETVEAGKPILEIADIRRMWLKLDVPKEDASKVALGQSVRFRADGIEQELRGSIRWISTEMNEQTRTLQVRAEVENPITSSDPESGHEVRLLRANTFGTGTITLQQTNRALVVPVSAVLHADHQPLVFARSGELSFERIDVRLGIRDGGMIQVQSTELHPGVEIVTQGGHILKSEWMLDRIDSSP